MRCPDHGEYEHDTCPGCTLDDLRGRAQNWYENLPPARKAVLVRQRKVRKLSQTKNLWSYFAGLGAGLTIGSTFGLYVLALPAQEPRYFSLAAMAGILLTLGFSIMRSHTHEQLCKLEIDRDHEEIQSWDKK